MKTDAAVVTCMDGRLHKIYDGARSFLQKTMADLGLSYDLITRPGGVLDLARPLFTGKNFDQSLLRDIKLAVELHGVMTIMLISHEDCGAYRNNKYLNISHPDDEQCFQQLHLREAYKILKRRFPDVDVRMFTAKKIYNTSQWSLEEQTIEKLRSL